MPVILTLSIGLGVLIFQSSGAVGLLDHASQSDFQSSGVIGDNNNQYSIENNSSYGGQVQETSNNNIFGVILGSIPRMLGLLAIPGYLGSDLQTLTPAPWWVAQPVGGFINIIVYIGGFQVVTGRFYE